MSVSQLSHIRKRDNRLVPFEPDKIVRSLENAARSCDCIENFFAREIAEAVILHIERNSDNSFPTTQNIAEAIENILSSLNHDNIAEAFQSFRYEQEKSRLRCTVWKPDQPSLFNDELALQVTTNAGQRTTAWDRTRIIRALEKEARISGKVAEDIAKTVERKIISADVSRVTTTLIRALTDNELLSRGYTSALRQMSSVTVPFEDITQILEKNHEANIIEKTGKQAARAYVLNQIYSEDIANAYRRGMLFLHGLSHPFFIYEKKINFDLEKKTLREIKSEFFSEINQIISGRIGKLFINIDGYPKEIINEFCDLAAIVRKESSLIFILDDKQELIDFFLNTQPVNSIQLAFTNSLNLSDNLLKLIERGWNVIYDKNIKNDFIANKITLNLPQAVYRAHGKDLDGVIEEIYRSIELAVQAYQQYTYYFKNNFYHQTEKIVGAVNVIGLYESVSILTGAGVFDNNESMACTRVLLNVLQNGLKQAAKSYNLDMRLDAAVETDCGKRFSIIDQSLFPELFGFLPLQAESLENVIPPYNLFYFDPWKYDDLNAFIVAAKKIQSYFNHGALPLKIKSNNREDSEKLIDLMQKNDCTFSIQDRFQILEEPPAESKNQEKFKF